MASYRIAVAIAPGIEFAIVAESVDELLTEYEQVKGSGSWLTETIMDMVPATERGEGVGALSAAIGATLVDGDTTNGQDSVEAAETTREVKDPWSGEVRREPVRKRSAERTEPNRGTSRHPASRPASTDSGVEVLKDRFGGQWTVNLPEAPDCNHGKPAALHEWTTRQGKDATAYKCALGAPGGNYRDKCDFFEYPN